MRRVQRAERRGKGMYLFTRFMMIQKKMLRIKKNVVVEVWLMVEVRVVVRFKEIWVTDVLWIPSLSQH